MSNNHFTEYIFLQQTLHDEKRVQKKCLWMDAYCCAVMREFMHDWAGNSVTSGASCWNKWRAVKLCVWHITSTQSQPNHLVTIHVHVGDLNSGNSCVPCYFTIGNSYIVNRGNPTRSSQSGEEWPGFLQATILLSFLVCCLTSRHLSSSGRVAHKAAVNVLQLPWLPAMVLALAHELHPSSVRCPYTL